MIDTPHIAETSHQTTAVIHLTVSRAEIQTVMGPGIGELMETVTAQGLTLAGPWYTHHLRMHPELFDFEIGVPLSRAVTPAGRVVPGHLPAATVARTVYHGGYEGLGAAWGEFDAWIRESGHTPAADLWEVYVTGPESGDDTAAYRTELNRPLVR